ncbi:hypothetical protein D3C71_1889610 [compost metagenome]
MLLQLVGRLRDPVLCKVTRRPHNHHSHVRSDFYSNHVLIYAFPKANTCIETPFHDVNEAIIHHQFDIDFRVFPEKRF